MAKTSIQTQDIGNSQVTFAKTQNISTARLLGRNTGGSGVIEELSTIPTSVQDNITRLGTVVSGTLSTGTVLGGVTTTLGSDATGDIYYRNGSGVFTRLGIGSPGDALVVSGSSLPSWVAGGSGAVGANPTASVGLTAVNGSALTFMRSDAAPPIDVGITPTWTGIHTFANTTNASSISTGSIITSGGLGVAKKAYFGETVFLPASTTSLASLNIASGTAPSSPNSGDLWHDSTRKSLAYQGDDGKIRYISGLIYSSTADVTRTSAASDGSLLNASSGNVTTPANFWVVGKTVRIIVHGTYDSGTGATATQATIKVKFGSTTIATLVLDTANYNIGAATNYFCAIATIVCRSTGGSGTLSTGIQWIVNQTNFAAPKSALVSNATTTVDTTASGSIDLTNIWASTTQSPTITSHQAYVEILN